MSSSTAAALAALNRKRLLEPANDPNASNAKRQATESAVSSTGGYGQPGYGYGNGASAGASASSQGSDARAASKSVHIGKDGKAKTYRRETGKVEQYDKSKGFGFLISDNPPPDQPAKIFCHQSHIKCTEGFRFLRTGTEVSFVRGFDKERNLPCCLDVRMKDGSRIDNEKLAKRELAARMKEEGMTDGVFKIKLDKSWKNVFEMIPQLSLESYSERVPVGTSSDEFFEGSKSSGGGSGSGGDVVKGLGSMYGLIKARFGGECSKYVRDKFSFLCDSALERFATTGVPQGSEASNASEAVGEMLSHAVQSVEDEFMQIAIRKDLPDGCEMGGVLFEYYSAGGSGGTQRVFVHCVAVGGVSVLACDATGSPIRLTEPHLVDPLTTRNLDFQLEQADKEQSLSVIKSGFTIQNQSIEYRLPTTRVIGARPFKKTIDEKLKLSSEPYVKEKARVWTVGEKAGVAAAAAHKDLFLVVLSSELGKWFGNDNAIIECVLEGMRNGRRKGENLVDSGTKHLIRTALRQGAPEDLSCQIILPSWQRAGLEKLLDRSAEEVAGEKVSKEGDDFDMFA